MRIWQVEIMPEYRATNAFKLGVGYLDGFVKLWSSPPVTMSSQREGWHKMCIDAVFEKLLPDFAKESVIKYLDRAWDFSHPDLNNYNIDALNALETYAEWNSNE